MIRLKDLRYNTPGDGWAFFSRYNSELLHSLPRKRLTMVWTRPLDAAFEALERQFLGHFHDTDRIP